MACSQRFVYQWDEVGRLSVAQRWDLADPGLASDEAPTTPAAATLSFLYDASDDRTVKTASDASGNQVYTLYPFDALELHRAAWDIDAGEYERSTHTEVPYLFAHGLRLGRVVYAEEDLPSATSGATHVFLELMDHLGSTGTVIDRDTSELVERSTYQGYGAVESDYRPERWKSFREDYRFTGKEDDIEVGISYFGKRYYSASLARWLSADPLTIHSLGADLNAYAYVKGRSFVRVDPQGLADTPSPVVPYTKAQIHAVVGNHSVKGFEQGRGARGSYCAGNCGHAGPSKQVPAARPAAPAAPSPTAAPVDGSSTPQGGAPSTGDVPADAPTGSASGRPDGASDGNASTPHEGATHEGTGANPVGTEGSIGTMKTAGHFNAADAAVVVTANTNGVDPGAGASTSGGIPEGTANSEGSVVGQAIYVLKDVIVQVATEKLMMVAALRPEAKYLRGGKHGIKWEQGPPLAKTDGPQGQWGSKADLDYAGSKAATLKPGEHATFPLPEGHSSVVHLPDGTTVPATNFFVRNNGTGTFHGFPTQ